VLCTHGVVIQGDVAESLHDIDTINIAISIKVKEPGDKKAQEASFQMRQDNKVWKDKSDPSPLNRIWGSGSEDLLVGEEGHDAHQHESNSKILAAIS
jgi:hypothetical protein